MLDIADNFRRYNGTRVLVTGHTGFKGAWLCLWLKYMGAEVMGIGLEPPSEPSMHQVLNLEAMFAESRIDINEYSPLAAALQKFQPEIVFHLAAQALVRPSYEDPLGTLSTNILGTAHVLEACRNTPSVRAVVVVTSDKCYQNKEWCWGYRENDPMGGHDPYSASKGCAELVTASYTNSFFPSDLYGSKHHVAIASARAGNVIGGGDWGKDRLVPDCIRALCSGQSIRIRTPLAFRPWQHTMECLSGYLLLGERLLLHGPQFGGSWNFGPTDRSDIWPVERVVQHLCSQWGEGEYEIEGGEQPHEARMLSLDCSKALHELKWRPRYKVGQALAETVNWYKEWAADPSPEHMREFTIAQIQRYMEATPDVAGDINA